MTCALGCRYKYVHLSLLNIVSRFEHIRDFAPLDISFTLYMRLNTTMWLVVGASRYYKQLNWKTKVGTFHLHHFFIQFTQEVC